MKLNPLIEWAGEKLRRSAEKRSWRGMLPRWKQAYGHFKKKEKPDRASNAVNEKPFQGSSSLRKVAIRRGVGGGGGGGKLVLQDSYIGNRPLH